MKTIAKALFVTGTGTDVGKTYVTALIAKLLRGAGVDAGYYKAAVSGVSFDAGGRISSDATFVAETAGIDESHDQMVSRTYRAAVSPHLAARLEGGPVSMELIREGFAQACARHSHVLMEGSGGIVCPLRHDEEAVILLDDVIRDLDLRKPIYRNLAAYGHMGREDLGVKWENTDRVEKLKAAVAAL